MLSRAVRATRANPLARAQSTLATVAGPSAPRAAQLESLTVVEVSGKDAPKFLNGLLCKNVEALGGGYTGFLNAPGRIIHTAFVFPTSKDSYLISCDAGHDPLVKMMKPFRLRSKVRIKDVTEEWDSWVAWGGEEAASGPSPNQLWRFGNGGAAERLWTWPDGNVAPLGLADGEVGCWDLRVGFGASGLGRRVLVPKGAKPSVLSSHDQVSADQYNLRRMLLGVPEGPQEITPGAAYPLESDMDIHGGVDFRKGCYLGQELTVRTYHTGATRKRILPLRLFPLEGEAASSPLASISDLSTFTGLGGPQPISSEVDISYTPPASSTTKKSRSAGRLLTLHGTHSAIGLGLVRLEFATRTWWSLPTTGTVAEWASGERGTLTAQIDGRKWGVWVGHGSAYADALANLPPPKESRDSETD